MVSAYSFSLWCVQCGNDTVWYCISLHVLVAYGPPMVFLGVIVVLTVSVNSAPLHGWILVCQLLSTSIVMGFLETFHPHHAICTGTWIPLWYLKFGFRSVTSHFVSTLVCRHFKCLFTGCFSYDVCRGGPVQLQLSAPCYHV